jgi:uncharacterized protein (DUF1499 family)
MQLYVYIPKNYQIKKAILVLHHLPILYTASPDFATEATENLVGCIPKSKIYRSVQTTGNYLRAPNTDVSGG